MNRRRSKQFLNYCQIIFTVICSVGVTLQVWRRAQGAGTANFLGYGLEKPAIVVYFCQKQEASFFSKSSIPALVHTSPAI
jgi:multisubunit Na+/H+ antiporter MnhG subunit